LLKGRPLVKHVIDAIKSLVEEVIVVASSEDQAERYSKILEKSIRVVLDNRDIHGPLVGASVGFENASGKYSLLLPCDTPFINRQVISLLLELSINKTATIPRWPNCHIEPLQAVYCSESALRAAKVSLAEGKVDLQSMINKFRGVRYISILVIQQLDPELRTFFNVNTIMDLKKAETLNQGRNKKTGRFL
jgi:molybdopterin-guanine dinucleotide biosynthesis protein A